MLLKDALAQFKKVKRPNQKTYVSKGYLEHFFSQSNPYTYGEWMDEYGYYVEYDFDDLLKDDWQGV